jgi:hypothetical protein
MTTLDENPCHFFRLPYELRYEIYLLATPPRVVHVREGLVYETEQDQQEAKVTADAEVRFAFKQFVLRLLNRPSSIDLRVHPEIAHFAHNWRDVLERDSRGKPRQTTLDEYGFRSSRGTHQPWTPTADTPAIPPEWLAERPWIAFEMLRKSYLWSQAPIPPLLHTCSNSRRVLMDLGYELAFASRRHGPRTWFHFGRDRLFLQKQPVMTENYKSFYNQARFYGDFRYTREEEHPANPFARIRSYFPALDNQVRIDNPYWPVWSSPYFGSAPLLSGSPWDVGPFSVADLRRVQYLILGRGGWVGVALQHSIEDLLPLVPNLKEIWVQEWPASILKDLLPQDTRPVQTDSRPREPWGALAVEEMDPVGYTYWSKNLDGVHSLHPSPTSTGLFNDSYNRFKNVRQGSFYESQAWELESALSRRGDELGLALNVPRFRFVHLYPERLARQYGRERHSFWRAFDYTRKFVARSQVPAILINTDTPEPGSLGLLTWNNPPEYEQWGYMLRAAKHMDVITLVRMPLDPDSSNILWTVDKVRRLQAWYMHYAHVPEPTVELL